MGERKKPELLAPAGDMERLRMAVLYGRSCPGRSASLMSTGSGST